MVAVRDTDFDSHIAAFLVNQARSVGVTQPVADKLVLGVLSDLRKEFGGGTVYIAKGRPDKTERAAEVYARYSAGATVDQLAAETGFTTIYVYRLLSIERARLADIRKRASRTTKARS